MPRREFAYVTDRADRVVVEVTLDPDDGVPVLRLLVGADDDEWDPEAADLDVEGARAVMDILSQAISVATASRKPLVGIVPGFPWQPDRIGQDAVSAPFSDPL